MRPDATATTALGGAVIKPAFIGYLDILGDPVRVTTWPADLTFGGTGDSDLDGRTFSAIDPQLVEISAVKQAEGGSETVSASLSGLIAVDSGLMSIISDPVNWRGRVARLWLGIYNQAEVQQGAIWAYYTGRMVSASIRGDATEQTIEVQIENYLATLAGPSNRTYLDQTLFDPGDLSAEAAIAIANGMSGNTLSGSSPSPSGYLNGAWGMPVGRDLLP
jgi:hypothetical protein